MNKSWLLTWVLTAMLTALAMAAQPPAKPKRVDTCVGWRFVDRADSAYFQVECAKPLADTLRFRATP